MALFERAQLPARSTLSRFLAALTEAPIEALRTLFLDDLLSRPLSHENPTGSLVDRERGEWMVFDIDGTREAARQRALPQTEELPLPLVGSMRSVLLVTEGANVGKWCGLARSSAKPTVSSGSAPLATEATGSTGRNCGRAKPPSVVTRLSISSRANAACFGSTDNMAWGPCLQTWLASPL
ncbi:hypothetical protein [Ktedonobacter robiniae]|uniref:hypothetical protein n=1 Tax=Ktedonobacter robiniae TaxID=2778365 RepID=UPI001F32B8DE|nr:hypothetical protein [Ktedonobacter robiniae]